jgi:hypothetical protein
VDRLCILAIPLNQTVGLNMSDNTAEGKSSNQMWGGRFASGPAAIMEEINASIDFDRKLYRQDIAGSLAHAAMLSDKGIISFEDRDKIAQGLKTILGEIEQGQFQFSRRLEDIRSCSGPPAHGPVAQRPGCAGFPALGEGRTAAHGYGADRPDRGISRARR